MVSLDKARSELSIAFLEVKSASLALEAVDPFRLCCELLVSLNSLVFAKIPQIFLSEVLLIVFRISLLVQARLMRNQC